MQRVHLTASTAVVALASTLVAPRLDPAPAASPPPRFEVVVDEVGAPAPEPRPALAPPVRRPWSVPAACEPGVSLVVAHELSSSVFEGRELSPETLTGKLERIRAALPDEIQLGAVGFAQHLWTPEGPSTDPISAAWLPLGSPEPLPTPVETGATIGTCANVALGLEAALSQLEATSGGNRALWVIVDGLHDCDSDGRFAYATLAPLAARADRSNIDLSVLVIDAWSERQGPTPLHDLVRGRGEVVHVPAWELDEGYEALVAGLARYRCP